MKPLVVPHGILARYPLSMPTVVAAMWELYILQEPPKQLKLVFAIEPFLERLGKTYTEEALTELEATLEQQTAALARGSSEFAAVPAPDREGRD